MQFGMISQDILLSSLADEIDLATGLPLARWIMMDMVVAARSNGCLHGTLTGYALRFNVPQEVLRSALAVLEAPDSGSRSRQAEGRRVLPLVDMGRGWRITTYEDYCKRAKERGPFGLISDEIFDTVVADRMDGQLPVARWVAMDLLTLADSEGRIKATPESLSRRLRVPRPYLDRALEELQNLPNWEPGISIVDGGFQLFTTYSRRPDQPVRPPCAASRAPVRPAHSYRQDLDQDKTTPAAECAEAAHGDAAGVLDYKSYHPKVRAAWRKLAGKTGRGSGLSQSQHAIVRKWWEAKVDIEFAVEVIRTTSRCPEGLSWFEQRILDWWQEGRTLAPEPAEQLQLPEPPPVDEPESETQRLAALVLGRSLRRDEAELARKWDRDHPPDHVASALLYLGAREAISGRDGIGTLAYCADLVRDGPREEWSAHADADTAWGYLGLRWAKVKELGDSDVQRAIYDLIRSQKDSGSALRFCALFAGIGEGLNARWRRMEAA